MLERWRHFGRPGAVDWNEDARKILADGWRAGDTAKEIAKRIPGATRNAVIGKARRLQLGEHVWMRGVRANPRPKKSTAPRIRPRRPTPPRPREPVVRATANTIPPDYVPMSARPFSSRIKGECAWPLQVADDWLACCGKAPSGSFCEDHAAIAYQGTGQSLERMARVA